MKTRAFAASLAALLLLAGIPSVSFAMGGNESPAPPRSPTAANFALGRTAIDHQDWAGAISAFEKVVAQDSRNADAWNWLGYASRKSGKLDVAFKYYDKALSIDPKHKGVYEYQGEAFLMANQLAKAESNLATLARLCNSSCEEYRDLKEAVDGYKADKR